MTKVEDRQQKRSADRGARAVAGKGPGTTAQTGGSIFDDLQDLDAPISSTGNEELNSSGPRAQNLEALLDISKAINSTLVLDDILHRVMKHAIALLNAERGFLMLLDDGGELQVRTAYNINKESLDTATDFQISRSVANRVAAKGQSEYTSNAQEDPRYAHQKSVAELNLRFIICVPLKLKDRVIGVCYLDNQSRAGLFGKSDLRLFELFAEQAAIAIENAKLYESLLSLTRYSQSVVNKTPVGIIVIDEEYRILTINATAESIWRSPESVWDGKSLIAEKHSLLDILPKADRPWWKRALKDVFQSHKPLSRDKYFLRIGGRETVLSVKISPLNGNADDAPKIIMVAEDITEKVVLEKYVILSEKMVAKGEMAASIGHELNNHLEILSAHSELLPLHIKRSRLDKLAESCTKIQDSIDSMARFTRGLMDYTQVDTELMEHNAGDLIEEHLFTLRPLRVFANVRFTTEFRSDLPLVKLDAGQMHSVLLNLYNNAADATSEDRALEIHIAARYLPESEMVEVTVADNGSGIPPNVMARLFEARFTTKKGGHGLGLSNCRTIIQNHGGTIHAETKLGEGTTFFIRLPAYRPYASFDS